MRSFIFSLQKESPRVAYFQPLMQGISQGQMKRSVMPFDKRRWRDVAMGTNTWMRSLVRFVSKSTRSISRNCWLVALMASFLIGHATKAQDKPMDLGVVSKEIRMELADLLREYKAMGLTLPAKDAKFVIIKLGTLAFEVEPEKGNQPARLLRDLEIESPRRLYTEIKRPIDPRVVETYCPDLKKIKLAFPDSWFSFNDSDFLLAIQCHAIGEHEIAEFFLKRCHEMSNNPLKKRLASLAWRHWICELATANSDRSAVGKRLKELVAKYPDCVGEKTNLLIESLDGTLKSIKKNDVYIERLIDELVEYHCGNYYYWMESFAEDMTVAIFEQVKKPDETAIKTPYRIAWQGFDAVPVLFGHFDDKRLSRCRWPAPEYLFFDGITHIDNWARFLLYQWTCHPNQKRTWQGEGDDEYFHAWWREVKQVGEEAYLLRNVLCDRPEENNIPYPPYLNLLFLKYPKQLPSLYKDILANKTKFSSKTVAEMIALGPFPKKDKLEWLVQGTKHSLAEHRVAAFAALAKADQKRFEEVWLEAMEANLKEGVIWDQSPFSIGIGKLAVLSNDPKVWDLLDKVAQAAPLEHLARFLGDFEPMRTSNNQKSQVQFLANFLHDLAIWEVRREVPLSKTIFWGNEIEIRHLACMKLAALWEISELFPNFTPGEWQRFREMIHARAQKELANK